MHAVSALLLRPITDGCSETNDGRLIRHFSTFSDGVVDSLEIAYDSDIQPLDRAEEKCC